MAAAAGPCPAGHLVATTGHMTNHTEWPALSLRPGCCSEPQRRHLPPLLQGCWETQKEQWLRGCCLNRGGLCTCEGSSPLGNAVQVRASTHSLHTLGLVGSSGTWSVSFPRGTSTTAPQADGKPEGLTHLLRQSWQQSEDCVGFGGPRHPRHNQPRNLRQCGHREAAVPRALPAQILLGL